MIEIGPETSLPAGTARADSRLRWARARGRPLFLLRQRGSLAAMAHDHCRLLAGEIEAGVLAEIVGTVRRATAPGKPGPFGVNVAAALYRRVSDTVLANTSAEFRAAVEGAAEGYRAGRPAARFTAGEVRDALVAIDVGNIATGLGHRLTKWGAEQNGAAMAFLIGTIGRAALSPAEREAAAASYRAQAPRSLPARMGCTGLFLQPGDTRDGRVVLARNFDGGFFEWSRHPGLILCDERAHAPPGRRWLRYAACGTAGLFYAGGISGVNEAGLSVSLHQMSTVLYDIDGSRGRRDIAPFVVQRILREAASLREAEDLVREAGHFGAWTILVADARSGEARRIEICPGHGKPVQIGRLTHRDGQSNHFIAHAFTERHAMFADAHFTATFNKWLETRARLRTVQNALAAHPFGPVDLQWVIDQLAGHADAADRGTIRSFGRVACKAYSQMSTVIRTDPQRRPRRDEVWITLGDRRPAPHATFAGFAIDWEAFELLPVEGQPLQRTRNFDGPAHAGFEESLARYVDAFEAVERPRGPGGHADREPEGAALADDLRAAEAALDRAIALSDDAGYGDFAYRFMRARLRHWLGETLDAIGQAGAARAAWQRAGSDWDYLASGIGRLGGPREPFETGLTLALSAATRDRLDGGTGWAGRDARLAEAASNLGRAAVHHGHLGDALHPDIAAWSRRITAMRGGAVLSGESEPGLPRPNFVTIE